MLFVVYARVCYRNWGFNKQLLLPIYLFFHVKCPCRYILWNKMKRIANTLLPAKHSVLLRPFLWKRSKRGQRQKVNTTFSVVFTVRNWKLYAVEWNGMEYCWRWRIYFFKSFNFWKILNFQFDIDLKFIKYILFKSKPVFSNSI